MNTNHTVIRRQHSVFTNLQFVVWNTKRNQATSWHETRDAADAMAARQNRKGR